MTHPGGISRVPSLETSLFSGLDDSKDVDAQRAIAALAAQLQGGDASRGGPPNPSSMVPPRPFPPSAPTATSSPIPMKPLPPSFHTFLDVNIKREVKDDQKYRQIIEALLRFVNGKISQDMSLKMIQAHAGREITVAIITQGIKEKIFTQQKPNPNPSMAPSPSPASPAVSSTPTGMNPALAAMYNAPKQTFYPSGLPSSGVPSPIDPKKTLITPGGASVMGRTYVPPGNPLMSNPTLTQIGMMGSIPPHLNVPGFVGGFNPMFKMNPNPFVGKPGMPTIPPTIPGLPMFGNMPNMPKKAMIKEEDNEKRIAASFKDVTDVTRLAGLDIKQEASSILQEVTESKEAVEEPAFLTMSLLKKKMTEMATRAGLKSVQEEAIQFTTIAVQEYMRTIIEALSQISSQRADLHKHELPIRIVQDPKHLLRQHHIKKAEEDKKRKAEAELQVFQVEIYLQLESSTYFQLEIYITFQLEIFTRSFQHLHKLSFRIFL
eukprot:TRINITY_DN2063_c0_g1_i6.p1 TRINITY_DN2063_c0_g1~~TRINITY_DN2063_c0_g1_i6.p1  ORF type:complete len:490 (+),score=157.25 TRINITY_DN2063_c0_g1_i6:54-1523(+)